MRFDELTAEQIDGLVDTRHGVTDIAFPPQGMQPYHQWLIRTLHRLAECSVGAFRVDASPTGATVVAVAPGRATVDGQVVSYAGGELDVSSFNNATACIWLGADGDEAVVEAGAAWPMAAHIKLAEVAVSAGAIAAVVDRRMETVFRV